MSSRPGKCEWSPASATALQHRHGRKHRLISTQKHTRSGFTFVKTMVARCPHVREPAVNFRFVCLRIHQFPNTILLWNFIFWLGRVERFQSQKSRRLFMRTQNEMLSVASTVGSDEDCSIRVNPLLSSPRSEAIQILWVRLPSGNGVLS